MFSFGVAHPDLFFDCWAFFKHQFGKAKKRSTLWQAENEFLKSNMDVLTVLSICWNTADNKAFIFV